MVDESFFRLQWLGLVMLIVSAAITILGLLAFLRTAITGALSLYQVALILMLAMPAGTFVYVVARIDR